MTFFHPTLRRRVVFVALAFLGLAACATQEEEIIGTVPVSEIVDGYGVLEDGDYTLPPVHGATETRMARLDAHRQHAAQRT